MINSYNCTSSPPARFFFQFGDISGDFVEMVDESGGGTLLSLLPSETIPDDYYYFTGAKGCTAKM